jgi:hypothetical protein
MNDSLKYDENWMRLWSNPIMAPVLPSPRAAENGVDGNAMFDLDGLEGDFVPSCHQYVISSQGSAGCKTYRSKLDSFRHKVQLILIARRTSRVSVH